MFNWLWKKLGGGKPVTQEEPDLAADTAETVTPDTSVNEDNAPMAPVEASAMESDAPVLPTASKPKADKGADKVRPKKAKATNGKVKKKSFRQSSFSSLKGTPQELPAKTKCARGATIVGETTIKADAARGKFEFERFYPKLVSFHSKEGHWNVPIDHAEEADLFSFVESLRQHLRRIEDWEEESKLKYSASPKDTSSSNFVLTPAQVGQLEKSGFDWKAARQAVKN